MSSEFEASLRRIKPEKRNRPLQRRPDSALEFIETSAVRSTKLLYDTTVYIDILQNRFPKDGELMLRAADAWHSPVAEAELGAACGLLDPDHSPTRKIIEQIAALIDRRPVQRTVMSFAQPTMNSSALGSRSLLRKGEGSIELNNCFNSATCTSMTAHLEGSRSPAEWPASVAETVGIIRELSPSQIAPSP